MEILSSMKVGFSDTCQTVPAFAVREGATSILDNANQG